jgi:hypothetical protein
MAELFATASFDTTMFGHPTRLSFRIRRSTRCLAATAGPAPYGAPGDRPPAPFGWSSLRPYKCRSLAFYVVAKGTTSPIPGAAAAGHRRATYAARQEPFTLGTEVAVASLVGRESSRNQSAFRRAVSDGANSAATWCERSVRSASHHLCAPFHPGPAASPVSAIAEYPLG